MTPQFLHILVIINWLESNHQQDKTCSHKLQNKIVSWARTNLIWYIHCHSPLSEDVFSICNLDCHAMGLLSSQMIKYLKNFHSMCYNQLPDWPLGETISVITNIFHNVSTELRIMDCNCLVMSREVKKCTVIALMFLECLEHGILTGSFNLGKKYYRNS